MLILNSTSNLGYPENFRKKVMARTCKQYRDARELGMQVMKSLNSEMRMNPRLGWVRANEARSLQDIERSEQQDAKIAELEDYVKTLERRIRDAQIPLPDIDVSMLAQGSDIFPVSVIYQNEAKRPTAERVPLTWDEILSVIGPSMYGYMLRRPEKGYSEARSAYLFEESLTEYIRSKIYERCGSRRLSLLGHEVDTMLIQFKQLGFVEFREHRKDRDGSDFRGYTLTPLGERKLTQLKVQLISA